jgi:acyl carrier protein
MPPEKEEVVVNVEETVKKVLLEILDIREDDITPTASLIDDLKATSIDLVEIVTALENALDVNINEAESARVRQWTVQDSVDFLKSAITQRSTGAP